MASQSYSTVTPRIAKIAGAILKRSIPVEVLGSCGDAQPMPKNKSDTVIFRQWLPYGATASSPNAWSVNPALHLIQEGNTPTADTIASREVTAVLSKYGALYQYSEKTANLYEDDVPAEMKEQVGLRMGLVKEMIRYGVLKGSTNRFYSGGTSRATVSTKITLPVLRRIAASLDRNKGMPISKVISPDARYKTNWVNPAYVVYVSTDCEGDIRDLPNFKETISYANGKQIHEREIGACERFRFVVSPELTAYADSGAAVGTLGLTSTTGTNIDVYPFIMMADHGFGQVVLRGMDSFDVTDLPPGKKDKSDPTGERGYLGATFYYTCLIQNPGWIAIAECGSTAW